MLNAPSSAPHPGLVQTLFRHMCAGAAIGYAVLHPASVIIYDKLRLGFISLASSIGSAFDLDHIWMAVYFAFIGGAFGLIHGINHHRKAVLYAKVKRLSITDALTGLYNRRFLTECLTREWHRTKRYNGELSLIMIDIDHFKNYGPITQNKAYLNRHRESLDRGQCARRPAAR